MARFFRFSYEPKRDEVIGDWRKLNDEGLHKSYSSPDIIRMINQGG
jgi:hypothetical protein